MRRLKRFPNGNPTATAACSTSGTASIRSKTLPRNTRRRPRSRVPQSPVRNPAQGRPADFDDENSAWIDAEVERCGFPRASHEKTSADEATPTDTVTSNHCQHASKAQSVSAAVARPGSECAAHSLCAPYRAQGRGRCRTRLRQPPPSTHPAHGHRSAKRSTPPPVRRRVRARLAMDGCQDQPRRASGNRQQR